MHIGYGCFARGLGVKTGATDSYALLQGNHILDLRVVNQGIQHWGFRGPRIAKNLINAMQAQAVEKYVAASHVISFNPLSQPENQLKPAVSLPWHPGSMLELLV